MFIFSIKDGEHSSCDFRLYECLYIISSWHMYVLLYTASAIMHLRSLSNAVGDHELLLPCLINMSPRIHILTFS